jgi:glutaredoxin-like protein
MSSRLSSADQDRLRKDFATMTRAVRLVFFTDRVSGGTCELTSEILNELPPLSDWITVEAVDLVFDSPRAAKYGIDRTPAIVLLGRDEDGTEWDSNIRFLGTPAGYEFATLIRAILLVGGGPSMLSEASQVRVAAVDRPLVIHVLTTPTCTHCPRMVMMAHEMAYGSPWIRAFAVGITEFPDLAERFRVTGVPKTIVNDRIEILGALPEDEFLDQVLAPPRDAPVETTAPGGSMP